MDYILSFRINQKIPRAPPSPPAPVIHSPTRKVTAKEQADWKIPPCISNWKNPKGFTVPLDKRLAADGRGLQQVHINENFAKMAEALSIAERTARDAVEARSQMERRRAQIKKQEQESRMREMALNARFVVTFRWLWLRISTYEAFLTHSTFLTNNYDF